MPEDVRGPVRAGRRSGGIWEGADVGMLAVRAQSRALRRVTGRSYQGLEPHSRSIERVVTSGEPWAPAQGREARGHRRRPRAVQGPCLGAVSHAAVPNPICGASDWGPCPALTRLAQQVTEATIGCRAGMGEVTPVPANDRRPSHADTAVARPVRVGLLGPVSLQVDGRDIGIGGARRRSALALLSLAGRAGMSATSLAGAMFGDDVDARTLNTLQVGSAVPRGCRKALTRAPSGGPRQQRRCGVTESGDVRR